MKIIRAEEMARIERLSFEGGCSEEAFMEQAGLGITNTLLSITKKSHITLLVSKGNNSGDAYVVGKYLLQKGYFPLALEISTKNRSSLCEIKRKEYLKGGGEIKTYREGIVEHLPSTVFLDGLFGTGIKGEMEEPYTQLCAEVNASNHLIISIDIPSGLNGTTGIASKNTLQANHTIYLGCAKTGFFIHDGPKHTGTLHFVDFGLPLEYLEKASVDMQLFQKSYVCRKPRALKATRHKYENGCILSISGSKSMPGAALLNCMGAFRSGAGIVYLHTGKGTLLPQRPWELIVSEGEVNEIPEKLFKKAHALVIGPGLEETSSNQKSIVKLLKESNIPSVIDASALNMIASTNNLTFPRNSVLTPHLQEMHRLLMLKERSPIDLPFLKLCQDYARINKVTLLLKGAPTFIFDGNAPPIAMLEGCAGLAKAGSGDVLSGIIAAFLARGFTSKKSALLGTYIHSLAGKYAADEKSHLSLTASDLIDKLPLAIKNLISPIQNYQEDLDICLS